MSNVRIIPARAGSTSCGRMSRWWCGDHPRSRGEHQRVRHELPGLGGSSPLARGARDRVPGLQDAVGIIPARAGSTVWVPVLASMKGDHPRSRGEHGWCARHVRGVGDHPRSRGEHTSESVWKNVRAGSSPLARGARARTCRTDWEDGIIPARAGSTGTTTRSRSCGRDHPRSRGEHHFFEVVADRSEGSSPLARGALSSSWTLWLRAGIIPARAGSTRRSHNGVRIRRDHPRSRGEHLAPILSGVIKGGSSPLARGARECVDHRRGGPGIIPARAGSTFHVIDVWDGGWDHPRSRGEHVARMTRAAVYAGSSPLARGAHRHIPPMHQPPGIIPARAGSTLACRRTSEPSWDHPRSRGEHTA